MPQKTYIINGKKFISERPLSDDEIDELAGPQTKPEEPSFIQKAWDWANKPLTTAPSDLASQIANAPHAHDLDYAKADEMIPGMGRYMSQIEGFGRGAIQGLGDVASSFTSPLNAALTLTGLGEASAVKGATSGLLNAERAAAAARTASNLGKVRQGLSAPIAAHGLYGLVKAGPNGEYDLPNTWKERLGSLTEAAGGGAGMIIPPFKGMPTYRDMPPTVTNEGPVRPSLPPADFNMHPDNVVDADIIAGQDIVPSVRQNRGLQLPPPEAPPLDNRITSIVPQYPDIQPPAEIGGVAGPPVTGFQGWEPPIPSMQDFSPSAVRPDDQSLSSNFIKDALEKHRAQMQAQVDAEMGVTPEEKTRGVNLDEMMPQEMRVGPKSNTLWETNDSRQLTEDQYEDLLQRKEHEIMSERNLEKVSENLRVLDEELDRIGKLPQKTREQKDYWANQVEYLGQLRNFALERYRNATNDVLAGIPQEMRVPGINKETGRENVAMGGASPRVLDVLGSSLYSGSRPTVATKELLQNAFDEHRIAGVNKPIKAVFGTQDPIPGSNEPGKSIAISDRGRGLTPDQIYTVLTNVGETGKAGVDSASGGFGFAKAAPFLGGKYTRIHSVVDEGGQRVEYSFEGDPKALKNQGKGVPLTRRIVPPNENTPTGLTVKTWYSPDESTYGAEDFAEQMTKLSGNITSDLLTHHDYGHRKPQEIEDFLRRDNGNNPIYQSADLIKGGQLPPKQGEIITPGAQVNIHFDEPNPKDELSNYKLHTLNKGLYQTSDFGGYGQSPVPGVPSSIVTDIIAKVEEGEPGYPFTANREQLDKSVKDAIDEWISKNVIEGANKRAIAAVQKAYDGIRPISSNLPVGYLDEGGRLTPQEIQMFADSMEFRTAMAKVDEVYQELLLVADGLEWRPTFPTKEREGWFSSKRANKFGILFQAPDTKGSTTLGIHIPNPTNIDESAILINIMEHLKRAVDSDMPVDKLSTAIWTTLTHEIAHVPGGGHDTGFAYRHAELLSEVGGQQTTVLLTRLRNAFGYANTGEINTGLLDLLSVYDESRQRPASEDDALLRTGVHERRPPNSGFGTQNNATGPNASGNTTRSVGGIFGKLGNFIGQGPASKARELWDLPRGLTSVDLPFMTSAGFRQGINWFGTKQWLQAWVKQAQAFGSEKAYVAQRDMLERDPLFAPRMTFQGNRATGQKSYAEQMGLELTDLTDLTKREEVLRSTLAERLPVWGKYVKASNRAYTSFLNHVRSQSFKQIVEGMNIWDGRRILDVPAAKAVADFVNTTTGRGKLKFTVGVSEDKSKTLDVEKATQHLADIFFSPRLQASRIQMLNPSTYIMAPQPYRKEWIKAFARMAAGWSTVLMLGKLMLGDSAEIVTNPNSSDFGKLKIGNTRIDPAGGFQQYLVIMHRILPQLMGHTMAPTEFPNAVSPTDSGFPPVDLATGYFGHPGGGITSPISKRFNPYGVGYRPETGWSDLTRFAANKLHPMTRLGFDILNRDKRHPVYLGDRIGQMFLPMFTSDISETFQEDPTLLPLILGASSVGMGTQTFEGGPGKPSITPMLGLENQDIILK